MRSSYVPPPHDWRKQLDEFLSCSAASPSETDDNPTSSTISSTCTGTGTAAEAEAETAVPALKAVRQELHPPLNPSLTAPAAAAPRSPPEQPPPTTAELRRRLQAVYATFHHSLRAVREAEAAADAHGGSDKSAEVFGHPSLDALEAAVATLRAGIRAKVAQQLRAQVALALRRDIAELSEALQRIRTGVRDVEATCAAGPTHDD